MKINDELNELKFQLFHFLHANNNKSNSIKYHKTQIKIIINLFRKIIFIKNLKLTIK